MMRRLIAGLSLALWGAALLGARAAEPTLTWRFAGAKNLSEQQNLLTWKAVTGLPEFSGFESNIVVRASETLARGLARHGGNPEELATHLRPILRDLWAYPSLYELNKQGDSNAWILAAKIPAANHDTWKASWDAIAQAKASGGGKLSRDGEWTLLGNAETKSILEKTKTPFTDALHINGDGQLLQKLLSNLNPSRAEVKVTPRGDGFRTEGSLKFAQDLPIKAEKWQVPTNTIREPLVGFSAIQGVRERLSRRDIFKDHSAPNQVFFWNEAISPFTVNVAANVSDPAKFISTLPAFIEKNNPFQYGNWEMNTNTGMLALKNLPIAIPHVRPAHEKDKGFVVAGLFPLEKFSSNAIPAELVRELTSRDNVLAYDWELTGQRLNQWRPALQLISMARGEAIPVYTPAPHVWLMKAGDKLGNAVSELSLAGPRELKFIRQSPTGFSGFELLSIARWASGSAGQGPRAGGKPAKKP